jgi:glucose-1-phosphate cytidylyltransferase
MKVVLFCGGLGMRLRDYSDQIPKPMVNIGYRPILWHIMKYYAHFGHTEFILCLGYKADYIKDYFLNYSEELSNDFTLSDSGKSIKLVQSDIKNWSITFVYTGYSANIGQRLVAVKDYLKNDEMFFANYSDNLTDFHLPKLIDKFSNSENIGGFLCVKPKSYYHFVELGRKDKVDDFYDITDTNLRINGGYFLFNNSIFDYIKDGEELVFNPFKRLIKEKKLMGYKHDGFWQSMDTFKDKQILDNLFERSEAPWELWKKSKQK